jgi:ribose transport system ATP-binding protein
MNNRSADDFVRRQSLETPCALAIDGLRKRFGATQAVDGASFAVQSAEVHALLGENGAGKSTMVRILSGLIRPDSGAIAVFGEQVEMAGPRTAHALGIRTAFQEISLVPDLTIADNLLLPDPPRHLGIMIDRRRSAEQVDRLLSRLELPDIDPRVYVRDCPLPIRQKIEITRAIGHDPKILLLDEPTSALSSQDVEWLARRIAILRASGTTIVLVTHRMQEVRRFCDRLTILRNGQNAGSFAINAITDEEVIRLVIGRSLAATFPPRPPVQPDLHGCPALAVRGMSIQDRVENVSFSVWPGQIVGLAGLQGMGQSELVYSLFGLLPRDSGEVEVDGAPVLLASPRDAIKAHIGISLVPEDRKTEALALRLSGRENVSLPVLSRFSRLGWIDMARERLAVDRILARVQVAPRALYKPCSAFSGGNQQKMAIAKWLLAESRILLLFDPTRGVDVGTKHEIYLLMREFVQAGGAILFYSTEVLEMVNLCDQILVMYQGRIAGSLDGRDATEEDVMRVALGQAGPSSTVAHSEVV